MEALQQYIGTWKHESSEGLDEFLIALGAGSIKRALAKTLNPTAVVEMDGDKVKVTRTSVKTRVYLIEFGVARTEEDPLTGKDVLATDRLEGDNWNTEISNGVNFTRSITDGKMEVVQTYNGVTCKRIFVKTK